jgi:hypothetical protein
VSPRFAGDPNNAFASSSLERKGSIERSLDLGAMTASTVLGLYLDGQQEGNELIMLSELQVGLCCSSRDGRAAGFAGPFCVRMQQRIMMSFMQLQMWAAGQACSRHVSCVRLHTIAAGPMALMLWLNG